MKYNLHIKNNKWKYGVFTFHYYDKKLIANTTTYKANNSDEYKYDLNLMMVRALLRRLKYKSEKWIGNNLDGATFHIKNI